MDIQIPWSSWFTKKTRGKPDDWMIVEISLEEEFAVEMFLRDMYEVLDPDEMPDLISKLANDNLRLLKLVSQAGQHIDKTRTNNPKKTNQ